MLLLGKGNAFMGERKKVDLRVLKTRKKLESALVNSLQAKPLTAIKVSDLCENAKISRATFYNNFNSVYEVFEAYLVDLLKPMKDEIFKATSQDASHPEIELVFWQFLHVIVKSIYADKDSLAAIFQREEEAKAALYRFEVTIRETLTDLLTPFKEKIESAVPYEVYIAGLSGLIPSALYGLFTSEKHYTMSQIERYLYHMVVEVYVDYAESHLLSA